MRVIVSVYRWGGRRCFEGACRPGPGPPVIEENKNAAVAALSDGVDSAGL